MYSIRVEASERRMAQVQISRTGDAEELSVEDDANVDDLTEIDEIPFTAGNPRVEHICGMVHLYRPIPGHSSSSQPQQPTQQSQQAAEGTPPPHAQHPAPTPGHQRTGSTGTSAAATAVTSTSRRSKRALPDERGLQLCCLALPADFSVAEFCKFCGAYLAHIRGLRVLRREARLSCCMVLITFTSQEHADSFYHDFHLSPFSILEPDVLCRLVFVRSVDVTHARPGSVPEPLEPPPAGTTELPTCPVCLERLDEHISGVVTTVCNHRFHSDCLQKWGDTSCPVCRYCSHPSGGTPSSNCATCGAAVDLWICLICGHVGCGRYREGHAHHHFTSSQHCYALELETQRVWDYVGDNYVHRLIQSKTDGKLVEVPAPEPPLSSSRRRRGRAAGPPGSGNSAGCCGSARPGVGGTGSTAEAGQLGSRDYDDDLGEDDDDDDEYDDEDEGDDEEGSGYHRGGGGSRRHRHNRGANDLKEALMASKLDAIATEYNHLLATQLDSQRHHYESQLAQSMADVDQRLATAASSLSLEKEKAAQAQEQAREADRRRQAAERKLSDATASYKKLQDEKALLHSLNDALLHNQKELQRSVAEAREQLAAKDESVIDLQEQVRDLMMFIEAQRAIGSSGEADIQGATLLPVPAAAAAPSRDRRKGRR